MSFYFDTDDLKHGIEMLEDKSDKAFMMYAETSATKLQNYARRNRTWTDRTSHARQRLTGKADKVEMNLYRISLSHGVDYGVYLEGTNNPNWSKGINQLTGLEAEFKYEKKYAIINPTIKANSSKIMDGLRNLMDKMQ